MSRPRRLHTLSVIMIALFLTCCAAPIPREEVPPDWTLNVHQPGEWWEQPLIPRSVVVQRCPPRLGWESEPDLTQETAVRPGTGVNYLFWVEESYCEIGWSEKPGTLEQPLAAAELATEAGLRKVCSTSGLPMDASWRYLGVQAGDGLDAPDTVVAAFVDDHDAVVACFSDAASAGVHLTVGADLATTGSAPVCPVTADPTDFTDDESAEEELVVQYELSGAGAVRDEDGRVLRSARALRMGAVGDSVRVTAPVVDGVAIVNATVRPKVPLAGDWDTPPPVQGEVLDANGKVLATCRA